MPVFNAASYLVQAIESVLEQDFKNFEFLIHDDGSHDTSWNILSSYAEKDSRIILSRSQNRGLPITLNEMIGRASGDLIARFDADDICLSDRFGKQVERFDTCPLLVVLGGAALIIDAAGRPIMSNTPPLKHDEIDLYNLRGNTAFQHPAVMMRKAAFLQAGGYNADLHGAEDHDLWLRMGEIGKLENLPDTLIKYRLHDKSVSGSQRTLQRDMCLAACKAAWSRRGITMSFEYADWRPDETRASRLEFYLRYAWQAWSSGYRSTWRHYAWKAVRLSPGSKDAWKALIFGVIRRPRLRGQKS